MDIIDLPRDLQDEVSSLKTVADKIRLLDRHDYERAEIARILGKRYQHVRNVLERDKSVAVKDRALDVPDEDTVMRFDVSADGTLRLPPEVMAGLDIRGGGTLCGRLENGQLTLVEPLVALRRVQEALRPLRDKLRAEGRSIVDELIAGRHAEAKREEAE